MEGRQRSNEEQHLLESADPRRGRFSGWVFNSLQRHDLQRVKKPRKTPRLNHRHPHFHPPPPQTPPPPPHPPPIKPSLKPLHPPKTGFLGRQLVAKPPPPPPLPPIAGRAACPAS